MIESASAPDTTTPDTTTLEPEGPAHRLPGNSMWTVSAVVVEADGPSPRPGVVASANLGDAAEQLCEYLPRAGAVDDCYLVARQVPLMPHGPQGTGRRAWISPIRRDDEGQTTWGRWIRAEEHPDFRRGEALAWN
ncbi:hypothetical protein IU449_24290 [Nocardia higoensis]|uniref:Uncharacterized protein n=1 Tax=Nocardia higoensis TaxID=228599 RepID=A0ABS0DLN8_9NOCA|nr:hypothetical protein [Nocardia higoensis]MBF6357628.1 hypothetical protein [Nocardia higoensis]